MHRLRLQYAFKNRSRELQQYPSSLLRRNDGIIRDVWDGEYLGQLRAEGYFDDPRNIAIQLSLDGVQLFKSAQHEVWPILALNLNLPPQLRYKKENFIPIAVYISWDTML
jgi:hypothetical protein